MPKDAIGNPINVEDKVVFSRKDTASLSIGTVINIESQTVRIKIKRNKYGVTYILKTRREHNNVLVINEITKTK